MADTTSTIYLDNLDVRVDKVFDVTVHHEGGIVLHAVNARIVISPQVMADIDQARREAQADAELDANRTAAP